MIEHSILSRKFACDRRFLFLKGSNLLAALEGLEGSNMAWWSNLLSRGFSITILAPSTPTFPSYVHGSSSLVVVASRTLHKVSSDWTCAVAEKMERQMWEQRHPFFKALALYRV